MKYAQIIIVGLVAMFGAPALTQAQAFECDSKFGACGTPNLSGGACGCGGGGSILIANTDLGDTYQFADDYDNDGWEDSFDNCLRAYNPDQGDADGDEFGDACDNCLEVSNRDQFDFDGDLLGNACDLDLDGDDILNVDDNCAEVPNPLVDGIQLDLDGDGFGDACDTDIDGDGLTNLEDACPMDATITSPSGAERELCFPDVDGDGISEVGAIPDVCPGFFDPDQLDMDGDGQGDACDADIDGDSFINALDNCAEVPNGDQIDADRDGLGNACDARYCYVVFGDDENCLDPEGELDVYVPALLTDAGSAFRLPVFINREDPQAFEYEWTVEEAPNGSGASVANSRGRLAGATSHEFTYDGEAASFRPDRPGVYRVRVVVTTLGADGVTGEVGARAEYVTDIVANEGGSGSGGCAVGGAQSPVSAAFLALAAALPLVLRRRRRA